MSNAFDDLWNSSASKPAPPRTLGSSPSIGNTSTRTSNHDAFAALASVGAKSPSPSISRTTTSSSTSARTASTRPAGGVALPGMTNGGDAFGNLLSGSAFAGSNGSDTKNMTMAQRAAHAERTRLEMAKKASQAQAAQASAWSGLDSLGGGSSRSSAMPSTDNGFDDFLAPTSMPAASQSRSSPKVTPQADDWGLDDAFLGKPSPAPSTQSTSPAPRSSSTQPSAPPKGGSLWDMDEFLSDKPAPPPRTSSGRSDKLDVVGDFDFGDREDRPRNETPENDDFLGVLSLPVSQVASRPSSTQPSRATPSPRPTTNGHSRTGSPPPHVIGQIVEMGFTPQQARIALAATDSGIDVQQALDALLAQTVPDVDGSPSDERSRQPFADSDEETSDARRRREARYNDPDDELPPIAPRRRQPEQPRRDSGRERADGLEGSSVQDQADKYIAQASDIGLSMFNSAKSFWSQGKEKVQKAYEERIAANVSPAGSASGAGERNGQRQPPKKDGRPKWMQEAAERDDDDWGLEAPGPSRAKVPTNDTPPPPRAAPEKNAPSPPEVDLFSSEAPAAYVSPFRRKATPAAASPAPATASSSSNSARSKPQRMGSSAPAAMVERTTVAASTSTIAISTRYKEAGTAAFKLGQYADATTGYTQALDALPDGHLLRVPLWNNRALARIRSGDYSGALEDSNAAVELIGLRYNPALEKKVDQPEHGAGVDLADGLVKGLRRRAEAAEGREKWADARKDWELLAGLGWAPPKTRSEAVAGAGRCRKAENPAPRKPAAPAASDVPRVKARPKTNPRRAPSPPGEALQRVQAANRAQEAEDDAKHALKDTVDAKLLAWKGNKETNVRALLGSLDTVLWPELNMPKVGMNQLITEKQVKIQYTKAIARLHPDKLNVHNTTLEQRMIANGVFAALNEAWIAFKP